MIPFSASNASGAPSAPELGCFPAREEVGVLFRAGNDTFFCPEPLCVMCALYFGRLNIYFL